jgi:hypothetical protein
MEYNTGRKLSDGTIIMLGDKIKGLQSADMVVVWDEENKEYGVEAVSEFDCYLTLDEFLEYWGTSVKKLGSTLKRKSC